jgi:hypothetical protein
MGVTIDRDLGSDTGARVIDLGSRSSQAYRYMLVINGTGTYAVSVQIHGGKDTTYYTLANGGAVSGSGAPYLFEGWVQKVKITPDGGQTYTAVLVGGVDGAR